MTVAAAMDQTLLWILGGFASIFAIVTMLFIAAHGRIAERFNLMGDRVTRLEAVVATFSQKAAKILHSPDDHLGIDSMLEKYLDRHYELSAAEWQTLLNACESIEDDTTKTKGERTLAAWLAAVCSHKLMLPPPSKETIS